MTPRAATASTAERPDLERAMRLSLGLASPLWLAFGAAASAGAAWWWMSRLGRRANLEADAVADAVADAMPVLEAERHTPAAPDDLTRIVGIGPRLAERLAERGVVRFADLAAWTQEDLAEADAALSLKGRAVRDAWVEQARRFAAEA